MATTGPIEHAAIFDMQALRRLDNAHTLEQTAADEPQATPPPVEAVFDWGFFRRAELRATVKRRNLRAAEAAAAVQAGPGSVLVVEDDPAIRALMCEALTEQGMAVEAVASRLSLI